MPVDWTRIGLGMRRSCVGAYTYMYMYYWLLIGAPIALCFVASHVRLGFRSDVRVPGIGAYEYTGKVNRRV